MRDVVHSRFAALTLSTVLLAACAGDAVPPTGLDRVTDRADITVDVPEFNIAASSTAAEISFSLASDGSNTLVGFQARPSGGQTAVKAKLYSATGTLLGSVDTGHIGDPPFVACDGTNYLLVWGDHSDANANVWGQFVSGAGDAGAPFQLEVENNIKSVMGLAYGGGQFLVTYRTNTNALKARFVAANHTLGSTVTVASKSGDLGLNNLASDGTAFVAVYTDTLNSKISSRLIHANGTMTTAITVVSGGLGNDGIGIVYNNGKYLVVWQRAISVTQRNPRAQLLTQANAKSGGVIAIDRNVSLETALPAAYGTGFFVGYVRWSNHAAYGKMVSTAGAVGSGQQYFKVLTSGKMAVPIGVAVGTKIFFAVNRATMAPSGTGFEDLSPPSFDVRGKVVTP
jgi:hypothetical protein